MKKKGNEYIAPDEITPTEPEKTAKKKKEKQAKVKESEPADSTTEPTEKRKFNFFKPVSNFFAPENRRTNLTTGAVLVLFSVYQLLSFISYFFTWKADQNLILNKGFFSFLFSTEEVEVANHLGKLGAWLSHQFLYEWFGLASFFFPMLFFVFGIFLLFRIQLVPLQRALARSVVGIIILSLFLGFFTTDHSFPYGGSIGYHFNAWLKLSLGTAGALLFQMVLVFITIVQMFNPDFRQMAARFGLKKEEPATHEPLTEATDEPDLKIVNTLREEDIIHEKVSEPIDLKDDLSGHEAQINILVEDEEEPEPEIKEEANLPEELEALNTDEFQVEVAPTEETLSDDDLKDLSKEFGDYDPKLDLSSYMLPSVDLMENYGGNQTHVTKEELEANKNRIVEALGYYNIEISKIKATVGPTVTLYEIVPAPGVRISKIKNLSDDIALSLAANGIRIIAPIPGKGTIGIEVPNSKPDMVSMRALISSEKFQNSDMELPVVLGKTISNETFMFDLAKAPHLLCAGATGQGKSVGLNAILVSLLYKKHPAQIKFVMVDPKKVELTLYQKIERHFLAKLPDTEEAIITDTSKVVNTMKSLCIEMDDRYELLKNAQVRDIKEYNKKFIARKLNPEKGHRYLPYIVVVIDEFADLIMTAGKEIEHPIARLAQLARAIGIHLIVATQRPSVNVITGMIKANFPARIAFKVSSKIDSRTILDQTGADQLIGRGDMLISFGNDLTRLQCGFVDTAEVERICDFIGGQRGYESALLLPEYVGEEGESDLGVDMSQKDSLFDESAKLVVVHQQGSASLLQRKLSIGYNRAGRIIDQLEAAGVIGPFKGSKAREVLISDLSALELFLKNLG
ncbi:MAG: DNA translocase FtsK [Bacteroidetes bacterium]|nr:DNA translocase FtsK [Bacteroidota bacterium]